MPELIIAMVVFVLILIALLVHNTRQELKRAGYKKPRWYNYK